MLRWFSLSRPLCCSSHREGAAVLLTQKYGKTFVMGNSPFLATAEPAAVRTLLLSRSHSVGRSWVYRAMVIPTRSHRSH
jgi:hypothetical protein